MCTFLTRITLLIPAFSLPSAPAVLTLDLHCKRNAPLPSINGEPSTAPAASALDLSPVTFSAQDHLTSELLRTLSMMAASKPTSWLSEQSHNVSHLAEILGP